MLIILFFNLYIFNLYLCKISLFIEWKTCR